MLLQSAAGSASQFIDKATSNDPNQSGIIHKCYNVQDPTEQKNCLLFLFRFNILLKSNAIFNICAPECNEQNVIDGF